MTPRDMEKQLLRLSARHAKETDAAKRHAISAEYRALHARWMQAKATLFSDDPDLLPAA